MLGSKHDKSTRTTHLVILHTARDTPILRASSLTTIAFMSAQAALMDRINISSMWASIGNYNRSTNVEFSSTTRANMEDSIWRVKHSFWHAGADIQKLT